MKPLHKFGQVISQDLRDAALNRFLDLDAGKLNSPDASKLSSELNKMTDEQKYVVKKIVNECIDCGIHDLLFALETEKNDIKVIVDGANIADDSDGLNGEIYTENGWFERFSVHKEKGL